MGDSSSRVTFRIRNSTQDTILRVFPSYLKVGKLLLKLNDTTVALIPKTHNPVEYGFVRAVNGSTSNLMERHVSARVTLLLFSTSL